MLIIRSSRIHEAGCYTTAPIKKGQKVIEYTGPRISNKEGERRYHDREHTFLFGLDDGKTLIDGYGMAAFINHCCEPNCETDQLGTRMWVLALRDIEAGEELTYDYNLYDGDGDAPCYCGAAKCRGSLYEPGKDPESIKKKKKKAADRKRRKEAAQGRRPAQAEKRRRAA